MKLITLIFYISQSQLSTKFAKKIDLKNDKLDNINSLIIFINTLDKSLYNPILVDTLRIFCKELKNSLKNDSILNFFEFFPEIDTFNINNIDLKTYVFSTITKFIFNFKNTKHVAELKNDKLKIKKNLLFYEIFQALDKINKKINKCKLRIYDDKVEYDKNNSFYYINYNSTVPSMKKDSLVTNISLDEIRKFVKAKQNFYINEKKHIENFLFFDNKDYEFVVLPKYNFNENYILFLHKETFSIFVNLMRILSFNDKRYIIFNIKEIKNILEIEILYFKKDIYFSNVCIKKDISNLQFDNINTFKKINDLNRKISNKISFYLNPPDTFNDKILYLNSNESTLISILNTLKKDIFLIQKYYENIFYDDNFITYLRFNDLLNVNFTHFLFLTELKNDNIILEYNWNYLYLLIKNDEHMDLQIKKITKIFTKLNEKIFYVIKKNNRLSVPKYLNEIEIAPTRNYNLKVTDLYTFFLHENYIKLNQKNKLKDINLFMIFYLFYYKNIDFLKYHNVFSKVEKMFNIIYEYSKNCIKLRLANLYTFKILQNQENENKFIVESSIYFSTNTSHLENLNTNNDVFYKKGNSKNQSVYFKNSKKTNRLCKSFLSLGNLFKLKSSKKTDFLINKTNVTPLKIDDFKFIYVDFHLRFNKNNKIIEQELLNHHNKFYFILNNQTEKEIIENENMYFWFKKKTNKF